MRVFAIVVLSVCSTLYDHLTILVNVVEQIDRADQITDAMVQDLRKAVQGVLFCASDIREIARKAKLETRAA